MNFHKPILLTMTVLSVATTLAGCTQDGGVSGEDMGTLLGAGSGAFIGSRFGQGGGKVVTGVIGGLVGAWAGRSIAQSLNSQDRHYYDQAATQAQTAPVGQAITWSNPQSGAQGSIVPTREGQDASGAYCREYQQTISVGGQTQHAYGTACRQPDGSWKIVNQQ